MKRTLFAAVLLLPATPHAQPAAFGGAAPPEMVASPWCKPRPDLPALEQADRAVLCMGAHAALTREFNRLSQGLAALSPGGDPRPLAEASDHAQATIDAVVSGCVSVDELALVSPTTRAEAEAICGRLAQDAGITR